MKLHLIAVSLLLLFNFASFFWAALRHFEVSGKVPRKMLALSIMVLLCQLLTLVAIVLSQAPTNIMYWLGTATSLSSTLLFWRCIQVNKRKPLTGAYMENLPEHLQARGPYKYIRHPFYTSYILSYVGGAMVSQLGWTLLLVLVPALIYTHASMYEEAKFMQSGLNTHYNAYKRQAGRFWPRLSRLFSFS
jgi:protein-S-isoprenylcysteine O-methyltransferase Ste14